MYVPVHAKVEPSKIIILFLDNRKRSFIMIMYIIIV